MSKRNLLAAEEERKRQEEMLRRAQQVNKKSVDLLRARQSVAVQREQDAMQAATQKAYLASTMAEKLRLGQKLSNEESQLAYDEVQSYLGDDRNKAAYNAVRRAQNKGGDYAANLYGSGLYTQNELDKAKQMLAQNNAVNLGTKLDNSRVAMTADYFGQGAKQGATSAAQGVAALGRNFVNDAQKQQTLPFLGLDDTLAVENAKAEAARNAAKAEAAKKAVETAKRQAAELEALNQKYAEKDTLADKALQMTAQGVGGMMPVVAANLVLPGAGGAIAAGLQGAGSGYTDALQDGANEGQAMANALLQGAVSGGMEKLVGGVPGFKQTGGLLDNALDGAVNRIGNKALRGAARWGLDAIGEGIEEMGEEALGEAASRFTYGKQGSIEQTLRGEKTLPELAAEYGQTFAGGALVGGVMGAAGNAMRGAMGKNSVPELEKPAQQQRTQQPAAQVPELQQTTQEPVAQETKPLTIDRTKFTGTKYADAAARTIDSAVAAGMKDSGSARTIVELAAQVAGDTGLQFELKSGEQVKADFIARQTEAIARLEATPDRTDAQTRALEQMREALRKVESGEAIVNGDITGNTVVLNLEAGKPLNRIVGHELTHRLEAVKKQYGSVADAVRSYAAVKGIDYEAELAQRQALYEGVEGADPEGELVADLVGDLLFTDYDFVTHLHAENRNLFQKIWDEIKHLYRMATAGSAEARQLEQLMHNFQKAYNEAAQQKNTATEGGGKYSLNVNAAGELHKALYDTDYRDDVLLRDESPAIMLAQKGVKNLPMVMKASHIRENVFTEAEAEKLGLRVDAHTHYHGLGEEFYLKVIDGLDNVKLAYRGTKNAEDPSRRENYFLLISEFKDGNGDTINVPVYIDERGQVNRVHIDVNKISTAFGRKNFQDYIVRQIQKGNLVRIKNRDIQTSERGALIAPDYGMNDSVENNIAQTARDVNGQSLTEPVEKNDEQTKLSLSSGGENARPGRGWDVYGRDIVDGQVQGVPELRTKAAKAAPQLVPELEEATSVDDNPQTHTPEEQVKIAEYKAAVDPDMAEYVDRVRGGEKLNPYTVTQTNDRVRQAMLDLTGLQTVGRYILLDENGVNHITKRHGGGNGSADGTMKESADVARAKYVLDNFDEAYLGTEKAQGYRTADGNKAPTVIFTKKIDGTYVIVEAVCDTKKNQNYIVSQYLSSVGLDNTKTAKAWHASMDAGKTSPRDTSETLDATTFANSNIAGMADVVKADAAVPELEKTGQTYEPVPELLPGETYLPKHAIGADLLQNTPKGYPTKQAQTETLRATAEKHGVDEETASIMTNQTSETISRDEQRERGKLLVDETGEELFLQGVMSDIESNRELNGEDLNGVQYLLDETLVRLKSATGNERTKLLEQVKKLARAEAYTKSEAGRKLSSGDRHGPQAAKSLVRAEEILAKGARDWANDNPREQKSVEDLAQQIEQEVQGRSVDNIEMLLNKLIDLSKLSRESKHTVRKNVDEIAKAIRQSKGEATEIVNILDKMLGNGVVQFSDDVVEKVLEAYQEAEQYPRNSRQYAEAQSRAHAALAATMKAASWSDKTKAWRYMSMLSSPRTSIKNTLGNISMGGITATKNAVKAGLEALANRTVLKNDNVHTAAIGVDKADKGAAYADADNNVFAQLHQTGRYEGVSGLRKGIEQNRRVFKNDVLEGARNVVSGSLDAQDTYGAGGMLLFAKDLQGANLVTEKAKRFSENAEKLLLEAGSRGFVGLGGIKNNYARAAAQYAKANGASYAMLVEIENGIRANIGQNAEPDAVQKAAGENAASMLLLQEARAYGIEQALKATFHDQNAIAQWLSDSEAKALRSKKTVLRAIGHLVEGILPFKSTPMNVLSRAVEYSPVGLATTILWDAPKAVVGKGEKTNADIIEQLASGLTGTGLFALGALLASMGALEIGGGEDDREEYYKKNVQGKQAYSLKFADGSTYTLDWLVPAAMPIFMGASTYAAWDGELDFGTLLDVSVKMSEPILETTMLSGLSDTIRSIANSRTIGLGDLGGALTSMAGSYAGQFVPVLAKQTGRAFSESAHSTYSGKQSGVARFADKQWKENTNWIPSLDDNLMYDQWGRPVDNVGNNAVGRLAYNLLSPGFYSKDKSTDVDRELNRLADAVGSTEVYPQSGIATASVTVGKETRRMSDEEMQTFSREKGRMSYGLLEAAMADKRYSAMSSQQKAKLVSSIYSLSGAYGRSKAVAGYELESEHAKPLALYETFGTKGVVDYYMTKSGANADGNSSLSNGELIPYLEKQSYTDAEKSALFAQMTKSDGKGYNSVKSKYGDDGAYEWMVWQANADVNRNGSASYSELIPVLEQVPKAKQADYLASAVPPKEGSKAEVIQQNYGNQGLLDLYTAKVYANTDGKGLTTKEAKAYLDKQAFTKAYKAALYEAMVGGDKNPYR